MRSPKCSRPIIYTTSPLYDLQTTFFRDQDKYRQFPVQDFEASRRDAAQSVDIKPGKRAGQSIFRLLKPKVLYGTLGQGKEYFF
jgi:hypothetical protein